MSFFDKNDISKETRAKLAGAMDSKSSFKKTKILKFEQEKKYYFVPIFSDPSQIFIQVGDHFRAGYLARDGAGGFRPKEGEEKWFITTCLHRTQMQPGNSIAESCPVCKRYFTFRDEKVAAKKVGNAQKEKDMEDLMGVVGGNSKYWVYALQLTKQEIDYARDHSIPLVANPESVVMLKLSYSAWNKLYEDWFKPLSESMEEHVNAKQVYEEMGYDFSKSFFDHLIDDDMFSYFTLYRGGERTAAYETSWNLNPVKLKVSPKDILKEEPSLVESYESFTSNAPKTVAEVERLCQDIIDPMEKKLAQARNEESVLDTYTRTISTEDVAAINKDDYVKSEVSGINKAEPSPLTDDDVPF